MVSEVAMDRISVNGKRFVDEYGRHRIFNGINYTDKNVKYCFINPNEYTELNLRKLSECGFNIIRLGVTWEAIEPEPCKYNEEYIDKIVNFMDVCHKYGMFVFGLPDGHFARPFADKLPSISFETKLYEIKFPWSEQKYKAPDPQKAFFECGLL